MITFANPVWLIALAAWMALTIWMLRIRRPRVDVPFVALWQTDAKELQSKSRQKFQRPPIALALVLLGIFAAIVAAAQPRWRREVRGSITIIVDRSVCMAGAQLRNVQQTIAQEFGPGEVDLVELYAPRRTRDRSDWLEILSPVTGVDRRDELLADIRDAERTIDHPIIVVSNQPLSLTRAVQAFPDPVRNVGIAQLSARTLPKPAVMVRLRNDSDFTTARLSVEDVQRDIDLPPRGDEKNYFFDLGDLPQVVTVELAVPDDNRADNRAWLVRAAGHPKIEVRASIPPPVQRMIDVFAKQRLPNESSPRVVVTDDSNRARPNELAIILQPGKDDFTPPPRAMDHAITRNVRYWSPLTRGSTRAPDGFVPVVSCREGPLIAVRENPARQVWIGADLTEFARTGDFVVFFADVFDWLGAVSAKDEYVSEPVIDVPQNWGCLGNYTDPETTDAPSPGIYRDPDGVLHAMNAIGIKTTQPTSDWKVALHDAATHAPLAWGSTDISPRLIVVALASIALASIVWRGKPREKPGSS